MKAQIGKTIKRNSLWWRFAHCCVSTAIKLWLKPILHPTQGTQRTPPHATQAPCVLFWRYWRRRRKKSTHQATQRPKRKDKSGVQSCVAFVAFVDFVALRCVCCVCCVRWKLDFIGPIAWTRQQRHKQLVPSTAPFATKRRCVWKVWSRAEEALAAVKKYAQNGLVSDLVLPSHVGVRYISTRMRRLSSQC